MVADDDMLLKAAAMRRALDRARGAIPHVTNIDAELGNRLKCRFEVQANRLDDLLAKLDPTQHEDSQKRVQAGQDLIGETLAFLAAASARRINLDEGVTSLAMRWMDQLSKKASLPMVAVVIPASSEFTGMVTQVVRLRPPLDGVWGLPVAIHEYGHFIASVLTRRSEIDGVNRTVTPIEDLIHSASSTADIPQLYWHGHELFSDAFAVATAGPAYTHYCIRYRFEPIDAHNVTATHPSAARRIRVQLKVLNEMAKDDHGGWLTGEVGGLQKRWTADLEASGVTEHEAPDPLLDQLETDLVQMVLEEDSLRAIRYRDHAAACALSEGPLDAQSKSPSVAHALNAAWCRRQVIERDEPDRDEVIRRVNEVASAMRGLMEQVIQHG